MSRTTEPQHVDELTFEQSRRFLFGLAYRLLRTRGEAEDAVQETWLKWRDADRAAIECPRAWLTRTCTRHCIDAMRAADRSRVDYVGTWLPEPVQLVDDDSPERAAELASSLSSAFLLLLDRLPPRERAAYLLREVFDLDYVDVAAALEVTEAACRKLVQRARENLGRPQRGHAPPRERQLALLGAFRSAVSEGAVTPLMQLLAEDVVLRADGGGKVATVPHDVVGRGAVLDFLAGPLHGYWRDYTWRDSEFNGGPAWLLLEAGRVVAALDFGWQPGARVGAIHIVRNPDKLRGLNP
jgi:RNA polymerase sigma factor (sigma-70 family)